MTSRINGSGVFTQAVSALTNAYNLTASSSTTADKNAISIQDILKAFSGTTSTTSTDATTTSTNLLTNLLGGLTGTSALTNNSSFSSYLTSNFSNIDANGDGTISSDEMTQYTNSITTSGLTLEQLSLLAAQSGYSNETLQTLIDNFYDVDANHDGKITQQEINTYGIDSEIDEKEKLYKKFQPKSMSVYVDCDYDDDYDS